MKYLIPLVVVLIGCEGPAPSESEIDDIPPFVTLIAPSTDDVVFTMVEIVVAVSDNEGIDNVRLWVDSAETGVYVKEPPYTIQWNALLYPDGAHAIMVAAEDLSGNRTFSNSAGVMLDNSLAYPVKPKFSGSSARPNDDPDGGFQGVRWTKEDGRDFLSYTLEQTNDDAYSDINETDLVWFTIFQSFDADSSFWGEDTIYYRCFRVTVSDTLELTATSGINCWGE